MTKKITLLSLLFCTAPGFAQQFDLIKNQSQTKIIQPLRKGNHKSLLKTIDKKLAIAPSFALLKGFIFTIFLNLKKISANLEKSK
jgi:hypothetical protein